MTEILVTGSRGLIGCALVAALTAAGRQVSTLDRDAGDITDESTWSNAPRADVVIHLAARSYVPQSWAEPAAFVDTNVVGTMRALDYSLRHGARVVLASSYLYGTPKRLPIHESDPLDPTNPYALSKRLAEACCRFHAERHGLPVVILRPFNVYGPRQPADFLIPSIIGQAIGGVEIRVKDLEPRRDYVHVDDVAAAFAAAVLAPAEGLAVYNIGGGASRSVGDVIEAVQSALGTTLPVHSDGERRPGEIPETLADISAAASGLGWKPAVSFEAGIADLCRRATSSTVA